MGEVGEVGEYRRRVGREATLCRWPKVMVMAVKPKSDTSTGSVAARWGGEGCGEGEAAR